MAMQASEKIWFNGQLIPWNQATVHVASHVIHYGSSVFEGIRAYWNDDEQDLYIFRLAEHYERMHRSARILRIDLPYTVKELNEITPWRRRWQTGIDGITYDIEPDGVGLNPVDNRSLRGVLDTAPFKWTGKNPTISRQCGPRLAVFFTRIDPFTPDQVVALESYIRTIPRNPNRYRVGDELTPAQRRGKTLFERRYDKSGNELPSTQRCVFCHAPPYFTNRNTYDVGTASPLDTHSVFDVPHLNNIYETTTIYCKIVALPAVQPKEKRWPDVMVAITVGR